MTISTIVSKSVFLVYLTFSPEGADGLIMHQYIQEFGTEEKCLEVANRIMAPEWVDWNRVDAGCTHRAPLAGGLEYYVPIETFRASGDEFFIPAE